MSELPEVTFSPHVFLRGAITQEDIELLIAKTQQGLMHWERSEGYSAFNGYPVKRDPHTISWEDIGLNIFGVRLGFDPADNKWHYFRIESTNSQMYYVDMESDPILIPLVEQLYSLVQKAIRLGGEIAGGKPEECATCKKDTPHVQLSERAHGLPGTVMTGSERKVCTVCETATYLTKA